MADQITFNLTPESKKVLEQFASTAGNPAVFRTVVMRSLEKSGQRIAGTISKNMRAGSGLRRRTGSLARGVVGGAVEIGDQPAVRVGILRGPSLKYAGPQEFGTQGKEPDSPYPTIRPVRRKFLTIPTDAGGALTPAGVPRYTTARDFPGGLKFVRGPVSAIVNGRTIRASAALYKASDYNKVLASRFGIGARGGGARRTASLFLALRPVYLLVKRIDLKAARFLRGGLEAGLADVEKSLIEDIQGLIDGGTKQATT